MRVDPLFENTKNAMLSFIIDIVGGYFAAKNIRNLPFLIFVAALIGCFSSVAANVLIYVVSSSSFSPKEIFSRIIFGVVIHPIITIVAAMIFRRKAKKSSPPDQQPAGNP